LAPIPNNNWKPAAKTRISPSNARLCPVFVRRSARKKLSKFQRTKIFLENDFKKKEKRERERDEDLASCSSSTLNQCNDFTITNE